MEMNKPPYQVLDKDYLLKLAQNKGDISSSVTN